MKPIAAILHQLNAPLIVDEIEIPAPGIGQVLVEICASGICGAQLGEISGAAGPDPYLPHLLGHEGAGVVLEAGPGVIRVSPGDHVVCHWRTGLGIEAPFPKYRWGEKVVGGGRVTTFAECALISENRLTPIQKDIPFEIAALMGCAVTTALGLVNREARLEIGQSIAVAGVGGVGLNIVQAAAMVGGFPIIAIDRIPGKVSLATDMGATYGIISNNMDLRKEIKKVTGDRGVDVFVDCTGSVGIIEMGYALTAPQGGRMVLVGQPFGHHTLVLGEFRQNYRGKTLLDSQGGLTNPTLDIPRYLELYRAGRLKLDKLITDRFSLERVNDALDLVRSGHAGRVMLRMDY